MASAAVKSVSKLDCADGFEQFAHGLIAIQRILGDGLGDHGIEPRGDSQVRLAFEGGGGLSWMMFSNVSCSTRPRNGSRSAAIS